MPMKLRAFQLMFQILESLQALLKILSITKYRDGIVGSKGVPRNPAIAFR
jgi:hypothetical protein